MATIADLNVVLRADVSQLEAAMKRADSSVQGFGSRVGGIATGVGTALLALGALGGTALKAAGDIQALEKGFAATYKGSEDLSTALGKVKELAKLPGLGLKEALQGATNLQAAGFSADLATRALGAFGNALATVGKGKADLDGVGLALSQIASKGKISAEEINQLAERVPQIRVALKDAFGTADAGALQKLGISATAFVEGVTTELNKLPKVTGGLNNAFENFSDATTVALAKAGTSINRAFNIEGLVDGASAALNRLGDAFTALEPSFRAVAEYFGPAGEGGQLFKQLAESVGNAATEIRGAFDALNGGEKSLGLVRQLVREITTGFAAAADVVGGVIGTITRALKGDFVGAEEQAQRAINGLLSPMRNALGLTTQLSGSFDAAFRNIGGGFDGVSGAVGDFGTASKAATTVTEAQTKAFEKQLKALQDLNKGYDQQASRTVLKVQDTPEFKLNLPDLGGLPTALPLLDIKPYTGPLQEASAQMALFQRTAETFSADVGKSIEQALESTAAGVGEAIGQIALGVGGFELVGQALLSGIGTLAIQLGQLAIGAGIAVSGIKQALQSLNPAVAIAGGIALVALGTFVKGRAASIGARGGAPSLSGGGGGPLASSPRSSFTPTTAPAATAPGGGTTRNVHNVVFEISGNKLVGLIDIETDRLGRVLGNRR